MSNFDLLSGGEINELPDLQPITAVTLGRLVELADQHGTHQETAILVGNGGFRLSSAFPFTHHFPMPHEGGVAFRLSPCADDIMTLSELRFSIAVLGFTPEIISGLRLYLEIDGRLHEITSLSVGPADIMLGVE